MVKLFANSGDPDQTPRSAASDLGLHCFQVTRLRVSSLKRVNQLMPVDYSTSISNLKVVFFYCYFVFTVT